MTHRSLLTSLAWLFYYGLSGYALYLFGAGLLLAQLVLFALPALALARFTRAPAPVLLSVAMFGFGLAIILEGTAQLYGLWHSSGLAELRLFGSISFEMMVSAVTQMIFLVLAYEALFDDVEYSLRSARERMIFFLVFAVAALGLVTLHYLLAADWRVSYSYLWMVGTLLASSILVLSLNRTWSINLLDKMIDFALVATMPLGLSLWLALENGYKMFYTGADHLADVYFFGHMVPLEALLLLFVTPLMVAVVYEIYLDDAN